MRSGVSEAICHEKRGCSAATPMGFSNSSTVMSVIETVEVLHPDRANKANIGKRYNLFIEGKV